MSEINEKILTHITEFGSLFSSQWIFVQALFCPLHEVILKYFYHSIVQCSLLFLCSRDAWNRANNKGSIQILQ